ncbi:hypothetical protein A2U01_0080636, partial [Trifolium medium]|nr:hypothetical protein [Trifolium medium]
LDNEQYSHVKATILNSDPLPPLRRAFNHVLREEARFATDKEKGYRKSELGIAFYSSSGSRHKGRE